MGKMFKTDLAAKNAELEKFHGVADQLNSVKAALEEISGNELNAVRQGITTRDGALAAVQEAVNQKTNELNIVKAALQEIMTNQLGAVKSGIVARDEELEALQGEVRSKSS